MKRIYYIGLDVDDKSFHGCVMSENQDEMFEFKTRPSVGALVKKLESFKKENCELKICYEATYLGYSLQRDLANSGYVCEVIAPTSIPRESGKSVKTDRIDSRDLADYYRMGKLKVVRVPDKNDEMLRDLLRSRRFIQNQTSALKTHILALFRRYGINYKQEIRKPEACYWTKIHRGWLKERLSKVDDVLKSNALRLLENLDFLESQIGLYEEQIERIARTPKYSGRHKALLCYRGFKTLTAMTIITELGDANRFSHPDKITSYAGMDIREYSSGGKEFRFEITKNGNKYLRSAVIEACQFASKPPLISKALKLRRQGAEETDIEIADRCMKRLRKKACRMLYAGKHHNNIKTACAREMLGFIWETLKRAA